MCTRDIKDVGEKKGRLINTAVLVRKISEEGKGADCRRVFLPSLIFFYVTVIKWKKKRVHTSTKFFLILTHSFVNLEWKVDCRIDNCGVFGTPAVSPILRIDSEKVRFVEFAAFEDEVKQFRFTGIIRKYSRMNYGC